MSLVTSCLSGPHLSRLHTASCGAQAPAPRAPRAAPTPQRAAASFRPPQSKTSWTCGAHCPHRCTPRAAPAASHWHPVETSLSRQGCGGRGLVSERRPSLHGKTAAILPAPTGPLAQPRCPQSKPAGVPVSSGQAADEPPLAPATAAALRQTHHRSDVVPGWILHL